MHRLRRILKGFLLLVWVLAVLSVVWALLERNTVGRQVRAVRGEMVTAEAAGQHEDRAALEEREAELSERMRKARSIALGGAALALLFPVVWGVRKAAVRRGGAQ